jgi:16S rRNA processing protein RimM
LINIGRIIRSQGISGELRVKFFENKQIEFPRLISLFIGEEGDVREYKIEAIAARGRAYHIKLAGVDSLPAADRLAGRDIFIPEELVKPLAGGQYYVFQLKGCAVLTPQGEKIGTVADVQSTGSSVLLVVDSEGKEVLIPFHAEICTEVDLAKREIRVELPEGLLELNEI